jgi:HSP20 family protein
MAQSLKKHHPRRDEQNREVAIDSGSWHPFEHMRRQFEHLFQDVANMPTLFSRQQRFDVEPFWNNDFTMIKAPAVDIVENEKEYEITAEVPGVDEKQLSVKVVNGTLLLKGEKREDRDETSKSYHLTERRYGAFERIFTLPQGVDADQIKAVFKSGVLKVTLPKKAEAIQPEKTVDINID